MNANDLFNEYTGTDNYYKHILGMVYTNGVQALCEQFQCYWFLDLICSYQPGLREDEFQVWTLGVNEDESGIVICTDGNNRVLVTQNLEYTDFAAKEATLWVEGSVILLPSEH